VKIIFLTRFKFQAHRDWQDS